ncbi:MAG: 30S ribosomal protein S4e [Thermoplasmata archaeon]
MSKHLKRLNLSKITQLHRKEHKFSVKPRAGPHPNNKSLTVALIIRDYLGYSNTLWETKKILAQRKVKVNGKVVTDYKFPVGFMDVVTVTDLNKNFRVVYDTKGRLRLVEIPLEDASWKLSRVENIRQIKGKKFQYNLNDGRNFILNEKVYNTGDSLKIDLSTGKVIDHIPLSENNFAFITGGKNVGKIAKIESYKIVNAVTPNMVKFKDGFETEKNYVFPVGVIKPLVQLPEVNLNEQ